VYSTAGIDRTIERLLQRDRQVVLAGLFLITGLAWLYLYYLTLQMGMAPMETGQAGAMPMSDMVKLAPWTPTDALFMFLMWAIMMAGMMIPSVTPMVLLHARVVRHNAKDAEPLVYSGAFFAGYIIVWIFFSAGATGLQWGLEQAVLPVDTLQGCVPYPLPFSRLVSVDLLARRGQRCISDGTVARGLLPGLLLVFNVAAVRGRRHESSMRRSHYHLCTDRKSNALGAWYRTRWIHTAGAGRNCPTDGPLTDVSIGLYPRGKRRHRPFQAQYAFRKLHTLEIPAYTGMTG
jgi:hypothetical protein